MRSPSLLRVVDAAYDLERSDADWQAGITREFDTIVGAGAPGMSVTFEVVGSPTQWIKRVEAPSLGAREAAWIVRGFRSSALMSALSRFIGPPDAMPPLARLSAFVERTPLLGPAFAPFARRYGFDDLITLTASDGTGNGIFFTLVAEPGPLQAARLRGARAVLPHVSAAIRLRRALVTSSTRSPLPLGADAILDTDGRLRDGEVSRDLRATLRDAVQGRERARSSRDGALEGWRALVDGRWTLVDTFERNGQRYVVAIPNLPDIHDPRGLPPVQRAVFALLLRGRSNKAIAYELGLGEGTVAGYLRDLRRTLGPRLRQLADAHRANLSWVTLGALELAVFVDEPRAELAEILTPAELATVRLALEGKDNTTIARVRGVSLRTVKNQLASAYRRAHVSSRRELAARARDAPAFEDG